MSADKLVSIVITTRNRPQLLRRALESVVNQSYKNLDIIVVDDGSDPPVSGINHDPRVRVVRNPTNVGSSEARNIGMAVARGAYLSFLDDDDTYFQDKTLVQLEYLESHPTVDLVFSNILCRLDGAESLWLVEDFKFKVENNIRKNAIHTNSSLLRRRVVENIKFDPRLDKLNDAQFFIEISLSFHVHYLPVVAGVWDRDPRADRIGMLPRQRLYENQRVFCSRFSEALEKYPSARDWHYGKLGFLGLRTRNFAGVQSCFSELGFRRGMIQLVNYYFLGKKHYFLFLKHRSRTE